MKGRTGLIARKAIVKELKEKGVLTKVEPYVNKVGTSERTKVVIEPRLSDQWFLKNGKFSKAGFNCCTGNQGS